MKAKDLEKTYGIRIPVEEYSDYYLDTLLKSKEKESLKKEIEAFVEWEKTLTDVSVSDYKGRLIAKSVEYLKSELSEKINSWETPEQFVLETNDFKPENGKIYVSFDIKEANWTVIKYFLNLDFSKWSEYSQTELNFPEALSYSKSLRQAILGQVVSPKRYDRMQKYLTWKHLTEINKLGCKVVSVNSEEIILEITGDYTLNKLENLNWLVPVKISLFEIKIYQNFGDNVIVKEFLDENWNLKYKSMYGVNGHKFYLHFKTLILCEELDDRDLLFKLEHKIFKWCGIDFKDYREYNYVKKWIKPLKWDNDDNAHLNDKLYTIIFKDDRSVVFFDVKDRNKNNITLKCEKYKWREVIEEYHYNKIKEYIED